MEKGGKSEGNKMERTIKYRKDEGMRNRGK